MRKAILLFLFIISLAIVITGCSEKNKPDNMADKDYKIGLQILDVIDQFIDGKISAGDATEKLDNLPKNLTRSSNNGEYVQSSVDMSNDTNLIRLDIIAIDHQMEFGSGRLDDYSTMSPLIEKRNEFARRLNVNERENHFGNTKTLEGGFGSTEFDLNVVERWINELNNHYLLFTVIDDDDNWFKINTDEPLSDMLYCWIDGSDKYGMNSYTLYAYNESVESQYGMDYMLNELQSAADSKNTDTIEHLGEDYIKNLINCAYNIATIYNQSVDRSIVLAIVSDELRDYPDGREPFIGKEHKRIEISSSSTSFDSSINDNEYVFMVKNGYRPDNPDLTYDTAFTDFFAAPQWKYFKSDDGLNVVEFTGDCIYRDVAVKARIQFVVDEGKGTFEAVYLAFNEVPQDMFTLAALIGKVFEFDTESELTSSDAPAQLSVDDALALYNAWLGNHTEVSSYTVNRQSYETYEYNREQYYLFHANDMTMYWYNILVNMETGKLLFLLTPDGEDPTPSVESLDDWYNRYYTTPVRVPSTLEIRDYTLPPDQYVGDIFGVRGIIESNYEIWIVTVAVYNDRGVAETSGTAYPNAYTYDIKNLDYDILFDKLTPGYKTYVIEAIDEMKTKSVEHRFLVYNR